MIKNYLKQLYANSSGIGNALDIVWCTLKYGASPNNYRDFDFKNLNSLQRSTYVTNGLSRKIIRTFNNPKYIDLFEDKTKFARKFDKYFGREWISTEGMDYDLFLSFIEGKERFKYKPVENAQGQGIKIFDSLQNPHKIFDCIQNLPGIAILEGWIIQHSIINSVYNEAVNCLRIITFCRDNTVIFPQGGHLGKWKEGCKCLCIRNCIPC